MLNMYVTEGRCKGTTTTSVPISITKVRNSQLDNLDIEIPLKKLAFDIDIITLPLNRIYTPFMFVLLFQLTQDILVQSQYATTVVRTERV